MSRQAILAAAFAAILAAAPTAAAQTSAEEWAIVDNSFLVEEAFNQDPHVAQHTFGFQRLTAGDWQFAFTQEWPAPRKRHQLSYTIPIQALNGTRGMGDVLVNYRLQVLEEGAGRPACAPRVSVILPSGAAEAGAGTYGVQLNLPFSKRRGDFYFHWSAGATWQWARDGARSFTPAAAGSVIYRARQMVNLMLESVVAVAEDATAVTLSPGLRGGWNAGDDKQFVVGVASPFIRARGETNGGLFLYVSYEGPVRGLPRK